MEKIYKGAADTMKNTFIILTHTDADGHLSGHIVANYTTKDPFTQPLVFYYSYHGISKELYDLEDDVIKDATVYITDLSICEEIKELIKFLVKKECDKIIHIDHHTTSLSWIETKEAKEFIDDCDGHYTPFMDSKVSAAFLCWVWTYVLSTNCVQEKIDEVGYDHIPDIWDFSDDRCFFKFNIYATEEEYEKADEYRVPDIVRYVSDNDIWEHKFRQSKQFATYYAMADKGSKGVLSFIWFDAFNSRKSLSDMCLEGERIMTIENNRSQQLRESIGYQYTFRGIDFYVMNEALGNSTIFGEEYDNHQAVCKWSYNGTDFVYSIYADIKKNPDIDLSKIAEEYGGGGHKGAAGFHTTEFLFGDIKPKKKESWFRRLFKKKK